MVRLVLGPLSLVLCHLSFAADEGPAARARSALARGEYPWYDAKEDAIKSLTPPAETKLDRAGPATAPELGWLPSLGRLFIFLLMSALLTALIVLLARAWSRYRPDPERLGSRTRPAGTAARVAGLPTGLQVDLSDPWGEAVRLRAR